MSSQSGNRLLPLNLPDRPEFTHRAHRFPGKFHPPLISEILAQNPESKVIADPMCGSGTTGVEAAVAGRDATCVDIDPLCTLMTRAKTRPVPPNDLRDLRNQIIDESGEMPEEGDYSKEETEEIVEANLRGTRYCVPYNLNHWFEPYVSIGFSKLLSTAGERLNDESDRMADAIHTSLAAMVRQISRADPEPVSGLEVTSVRKKELEAGINFDVVGSFKRVTSRLANGYDALHNVNHQIGEVQVVRGDARDFDTICGEVGHNPDLVITSPPYCNAIEYSRRHRLEYEWLGLFNMNDVTNQRQERIEASRQFFGSVTVLKDTLEDLEQIGNDEISRLLRRIERDGNERKANLLRKYFLDAYDWLSRVRKALRDEGKFYMIVGPSTSYGHTVDTPKYLSEIATNKEIGFELVGERRYRLINNKMQYPTNGETTKFEALLEFNV